MTERLLQYIWQFQYFNPASLCTEEGEVLEIIYPGMFNTNQGPDFLNAKIKIGNTTWAGSIELHIRSTDWNNHKHSGDMHYSNVILHVVWEHNANLELPFSTLTLQDKVPKILLKRYDELMRGAFFIACEKNIHQVGSLSWQNWKERVLAERLEDRTAHIFDQLKKNKNHWEEICWWLLAKNFGVPINSAAFERMAQSISINVLAKHKGQIHQTEALLFGQAGLLNDEFTEDYPKMLQREYRFLRKKYGLQPVEGSIAFLRMRPSNFPTVRLAQLAMLIHNSQHLFARIKESTDLETIRCLLQVTANDYWHYHYTFDETTAFKKKSLGGQMIGNILVNTVVPLLFAYGHYHNEDVYKDKALAWLQQIAAEQNAITKGFTALGIENKTAFDSQALIQLKHAYCDKKRCLDCSAGNALLKSS